MNKNDTSLSDAFINRLGEEFYRQEVWWGRGASVINLGGGIKQVEMVRGSSAVM